MEKELTPGTKQAPPPHTGSSAPQTPPEITARDGTTLEHADESRKLKKNVPSLLVPEASGRQADRYMSPTDFIISPVSRRLLARNRKGALPRQGRIPIPPQGVIGNPDGCAWRAVNPSSSSRLFQASLWGLEDAGLSGI